MAVPGLMGGDVPDWLARWLTGQGFLSSNSQTSAPNGLLQQSKAIFDSLDKKPKEIFPQDNEGGSPFSDPEPINFNALTPEEVANVARTGFKNDTERNWATLGLNVIGGLIPGGNIFTNLGVGANKNAAIAHIDKELAKMDKYGGMFDLLPKQEERNKEIRTIFEKAKDDSIVGNFLNDRKKSLENIIKTPVETVKTFAEKVTGLFDTPTYSPTLGYSDKQIKEARKMGLEGIDPSPSQTVEVEDEESSMPISEPVVKPVLIGDHGYNKAQRASMEQLVQQSITQPVLEQVINEIDPPMNLTPTNQRSHSIANFNKEILLQASQLDSAINNQRTSYKSNPPLPGRKRNINYKSGTVPHIPSYWDYGVEMPNTFIAGGSQYTPASPWGNVNKDIEKTPIPKIEHIRLPNVVEDSSKSDEEDFFGWSMDDYGLV